MTDHRRRMLLDGLIAGVSGYAAVALFFVVVNILTGQPPLFTAALLGEATFGGLRDLTGVSMDPRMVLAFNGVQIVALLVFGFIGAWLMYETELHPTVWYVTFFAFLAVTVAGSAAVVSATVLSGRLISPWLVVVASLVGTFAVMTYLAIGHRDLLRMIRGTVSGDAGMSG